jgi:prepilin-type N-terminal cleavage/methylation domain-containing protein
MIPIEKKSPDRQAGFTLVEILICLAIVGAIGLAAALIISQIYQQNDRATSNMKATGQLENMAYWLSRDALMTQTITPTIESAFPLVLSWQDVDENTSTITYELSENTLLRRFDENGAINQITLVENIKTTDTNWSYSGGLLTVQVATVADKKVDTRTFQVKLRVDQPL